MLYTLFGLDICSTVEVNTVCHCYGPHLPMIHYKIKYMISKIIAIKKLLFLLQLISIQVESMHTNLHSHALEHTHTHDNVTFWNCIKPTRARASFIISVTLAIEAVRSV